MQKSEQPHSTAEVGEVPQRREGGLPVNMDQLKETMDFTEKLATGKQNLVV